MKAVLTLICCLLSFGLLAQNRPLSDGNKAYKEGDYEKAAQHYKEAISTNPSSAAASYNLANALYKQKHFDSARAQMEQAKKLTGEAEIQSRLNYNQGNSYMEAEQWQEAIERYKDALRANPNDQDAKYNLSYAWKMWKRQQEQNQDQQKNQDQNQDHNQDQDQNQDQDSSGDDQGKEEGDKPDQQPQGEQDAEDKESGNEQDPDDSQQGDDADGKNAEDEQQGQRPKPMPSKLTEKQAEQLLQALQKEEAALQEKKGKEEGQPVYQEKDW